MDPSTSFDRAGSLLGVAPTEQLGEPEDDEGAPAGPGLRLVTGGERGRPHRGGHGGVPGHVKEAFADWVSDGCRGDRLVVGVLGAERPLRSVLRSVAGCPDPLPGPAREALGLPDGATYGEAARVVTRGVLEGIFPAEEPEELDPPEDVERFLAGLGPREDRYDPDDPLANLGWPVVIRGLLYRVDDEMLIGMEGQPDLGWDAFDPSEARPAPRDVVTSHAPSPRP